RVSRYTANLWKVFKRQPIYDLERGYVQRVRQTCVLPTASRRDALSKGWHPGHSGSAGARSQPSDPVPSAPWPDMAPRRERDIQRGGPIAACDPTADIAL